jgi:hypothetical protein
MADAALYRQIVDVLLAEHEKSTPPQPRDAGTARKLTVTWGLYCQIYRLARSAMMLADNGMDQEGLVLVRVMLEHTIMLHWIVERGDDGIDAMHANQSKQMTRTFDRARGTAMEVPEAIAGKITASFDGRLQRPVLGLRDLEPVSPPVSVHEQRLHRAGDRCPPAHAATRLPGERPDDRALPDLGAASPGPARARPGPRART